MRMHNHYILAIIRRWTRLTYGDVKIVV